MKTKTIFFYGTLFFWLLSGCGMDHIVPGVTSIDPSFLESEGIPREGVTLLTAADAGITKKSKPANTHEQELKAILKDIPEGIQLIDPVKFDVNLELVTAYLEAVMAFQEALEKNMGRHQKIQRQQRLFVLSEKILNVLAPQMRRNAKIKQMGLKIDLSNIECNPRPKGLLFNFKQKDAKESYMSIGLEITGMKKDQVSQYLIWFGVNPEKAPQDAG